MKILTIILILISIVKLQCSSIDTALNIANSVYDHDQATSVVWWYENTEGVTEFLKSFNGVIVTVSLDLNMDKEINTIQKTIGFKQTVIFANCIFEYEYFLNIIKKLVVVPIKLIVVLDKPGVDISEVTKIAWNNSLSDIIIISEESNGHITISTYFPYDGTSCGNYTPTILKDRIENFFPKKYSNFYGCPIKVTLYHFLPYVNIKEDNGTLTSIGGIVGDIFLLLIDQLNASLIIFRHANKGNMGSVINGTATGSFRDVVEGNADILVPAGLINTERYSAAQSSHVIETSVVYWCGPNRREIYVWAKIVLHFFSRSAPYFFLTSILFIIIVMVFNKIKKPIFISKDSVSFNSYKIFLGQETRFETNSSIINSLYVLWIWFCLIVRIVYQGDLVDGLHKAFLEPPLTTLEDAVERVDGFGGIDLFRDLYRDTPLWSRFKILRLDEVPIYVNKIADGKRFLIASDMLVLRQFRRRIQMLEIPVTKTHMAYFMRPGWSAAKEIDGLILRMIESGFIDKIFKDFNYDWIKATEVAKEISNVRAIDMATVSACFYGLFVLWLVCFIIFVIEIVYFKIMQKKSKTKIG